MLYICLSLKLWLQLTAIFTISTILLRTNSDREAFQIIEVLRAYIDGSSTIWRGSILDMLGKTTDDLEGVDGSGELTSMIDYIRQARTIIIMVHL
jgi:hypothetical protein